MFTNRRSLFIYDSDGRVDSIRMQLQWSHIVGTCQYIEWTLRASVRYVCVLAGLRS